MVRLTKIYTRTGDEGETSLGDGQRVPKTHPRIEAYGTVDELNASLGAVLALGEESLPDRDRLAAVRNDLFDVGADLCVPPGDDEAGASLRVRPEQASSLEEWIDALNRDLEPLNSFVLPGGSPAASLLHVARTQCRRAERRVHALQQAEGGKVNPHLMIYLNRLSDLLFVLSRAANKAAGAEEPLWKPGG